MSVVDSILHEILPSLDLILLRQVQNDRADKAREDKADILSQRPKVFVQSVRGEADHVDEEERDEGALAEGRDDDVDQDQVPPRGALFVNLDHLFLPLDVPLFILINFVLLVLLCFHL